MGASCCCDREEEASLTEIKPRRPSAHPETSKTDSSRRLSGLKVQVRTVDSIRTLEEPFKNYYTVLARLGSRPLYRSLEKATGLTCIIQEIPRNHEKSAKNINKLPPEALIWRKLDHPNVLKLLEVVQDHKSVYLIAEGCAGQDFYECLRTRKPFPESEAAVLMTQVLEVLSASHKQGIIYRHLRPSSFLLVSGSHETLKLADFGSACLGSQKQPLKTEDLSDFVAPEVRRGAAYSEKCDLWSAGMILLQTCTGQSTACPSDLLSELSARCRLSPKAMDLLRELLATEPASRPTAAACLRHPWLAKSVDSNLQATLKDTLANAQEKGAQEALKQAVMGFICTRVMGLSEFSDLKKLFHQLDENGDGRISKTELLKGIQTFSSRQDSLKEAESLLELLDTDHSGSVEYTEFLIMTSSDQKVLTDHNMQIAFRSIDQDQSGKISVTELKTLLRIEGATEEVWERYVAAIDGSGDGEIDYAEFKAWITQVCHGD